MLNRVGELMRSISFLLVALFLLAARANGQIVELSPTVQEIPKNSPNVYYKSLRWFSHATHKGVITWKVTGVEVGFKDAVDHEQKLTTFTGSGDDLSEVTIPANAVVIWGKKTKGNFTLSAMGTDSKGKVIDLGSIPLYSTGLEGGGGDVVPPPLTKYQKAFDLDKAGLPDALQYRSILAEAYKLQAGAVKPMTANEFASIITKLNEASVNSPNVKRLVNVRRAIGEDFEKILPADGNANINVDAVRALLFQSAATLEELK